MPKRAFAVCAGFCFVLVAGLLTVPALAADAKISVTDADGKPILGAVVIIKAVNAASAPAPAPAKPVRIRQEGREYLPKVAVVQQGGSVEFSNEDSFGHHVYSFSRAKKFELINPTGEVVGPVVLDKEGIVPLGCNIHDNMLAYLVVTSSPFYGQTGPAGNALVNNLPPGRYTVQAWHPEALRRSTRQTVEIDVVEGKAAAANLSLDLRKRKKRQNRPGFDGKRYR